MRTVPHSTGRMRLSAVKTYAIVRPSSGIMRPGIAPAGMAAAISTLSLPSFRATTSTRTNDRAHVGHSTLDPSFALHSSTERSSSSTRSLGHLPASPPRCPGRTCETCGSRPPTLQGFWRALRAVAAMPPIQPPQVASSASMRSRASMEAAWVSRLLPSKLSATAVALHRRVSPCSSWPRSQNTAISNVHAIPLSTSHYKWVKSGGRSSRRTRHTKQMTSKRYVAS